jgi:peptidoglycan hydrolase-like protein with peptidoglycan-binding domain
VTARDQTAEQAPDPSAAAATAKPAGAGATLAAPLATVIARGTVEQIVGLVKSRPAQRSQIFEALHRERGNAFVQQIVAAAAAKAEVADEPAEIDEPGDGDRGAKKNADPNAKLARFNQNDQLAMLDMGLRTFQKGDKGPEIRRLQQALYDLGYPLSVHALFDDVTEAQVKILQRQSKLPDSGKIDLATFHAIEDRFRNRTIYVGDAQVEAPGMKDTPRNQLGVPPTALMRETHNLSPTEKAEAFAALKPDARDVGDFHRKIPGKPDWDVAVKTELRKIITKLWHNHGEHVAEAHSHKNRLFKMTTMVDIGMKAKTATDSVYGSYAVGPAFTGGVNLRDKFEVESKAIAKSSPKALDDRVENRIQYLMNTEDTIEKINRAYGADPARTEEKGLAMMIRIDLGQEMHEKILDIERGWDASAEKGEGGVRIQMFKSADAAANRRIMWDRFGTLIHEYIHTLAHSNWRQFREDTQAKDSKAALAVREGVTEFLSRAVLSTINPRDKATRQAIEGEFYEDEFGEDGEVPDISSAGGYNTATSRAEQLVGAVGIYNLYAAYFLGQTKLVGA